MGNKVIKHKNYDVIIDDGKVDTIYQKITEVRESSVKVISKNNKEYFVKLSDKVKIFNTIKEQDTAVIKTFNECWLVVDIIPYVKEETDESEEELQRQIKQFTILGGGY